MKIAKTSSAVSALSGIYSLLLTVSVVAALWVGKIILIPLALAALLAFLLSPVVRRMERWIGRTVAILLVVTFVAASTGFAGYVVTRQVIDLAAKLPDYKANIQTKLRSFQGKKGGSLSRVTETLEELKKELPGATKEETEPTPTKAAPERAVPVKVVEEQSFLGDTIQTFLGSLMGALGTGGLVLLLVVFMLLQREDLRGRFIRLIGQGRISAITRAMDDASQRVSRYLLMQLVINVTYGIAIGAGLYFIGIPNAILWGGLAIVLRFIPYVGPWVAAAFPILLSLAISDRWEMPLFTLSLFLVIELISNNVMEPWLYGSSTGVSSMALIVGAVAWTWLWGPIGLVLATPLTVCLVVMGRHVPKLQYLSVLLSDEQALAPHEECYHRMLATDQDAAISFVDSYLTANSLTQLYDSVLIPVLTAAEVDHRRESLDAEQLTAMHQSLRDLVEDFATRPAVESKVPADTHTAETGGNAEPSPRCRVLCLPSRSVRDEISAEMLTQLLTQQSFVAGYESAQLTSGELIDRVDKSGADAVCISVVPPSTVIHARYLCVRLRQRYPLLRIVVGLWGATEGVADSAHRLRASGADEVVVSFAEAVVQLGKISAHLAEEMTLAPIPADEDIRLAALNELHLLDSAPDPLFDRVTTKLARIFEVPIALATLVDSERQVFKAQIGLPEDLAAEGCTLRSVSVCGHVVASNDIIVVEDLARDPRFANNPFLKVRGLRFYAGVPLRAPNGQPIGSLCIIDYKPRKISEREKRLLMMVAEEAMEELKARTDLASATAAA